MTEPQLTPEAEKAISQHVWRLIIPSGIGLTVISFLLGFFVNEVARSNAYTNALDDFSGKIIDAAKEVGAAKGRAETAAAEAERLTAQITSINNKLQELVEENSRTNEQLAENRSKIEDARKVAEQTGMELKRFQQMVEQTLGAPSVDRDN